MKRGMNSKIDDDARFSLFMLIIISPIIGLIIYKHKEAEAKREARYKSTSMVSTECGLYYDDQVKSRAAKWAVVNCKAPHGHYIDLRSEVSCLIDSDPEKISHYAVFRVSCARGEQQ